MKRIVSILLITCLLLGVCPVSAMANKEVNIKYLQVSINEEIQNYECLWNNKEIYCSIENLAKISNYNYMQSEDNLEFEFFKEYENDIMQLQTNVLVKVDNDRKMAEIEAMHESYSVTCYVNNGEVFLPLEKILYLLHARWEIKDDIVCVKPMPLTILDFMAIHKIELEKIASVPEDVLIDTGWLFSDSKWGQAVYSTVAEVFNDFDGKIFILWWPDKGHVETAEGYENAILQLAKKDEEFIGEDVQNDAMEMAVNSIFSLNNECFNKVQNIISIPGNIDEIVQSIPDAVSILKKAGVENEIVGNIATQIENGDIDSLFFKIPELESKVKQLGTIGDGLAILQVVWNVYDVASRINGWNEEYLEQLQILADYENSKYVNKNVAGYVQSSAKRLIDSCQNPTKAATDEALQNTISLLLSKTFDESPFGKAFSIMGAIGSCYGIFDIKAADVYDVYSELSVVTFSIKVEQLVHKLFEYENILNTTNKLTTKNIEDARNQLMLYLRLNLRNKAQLYNLNVKGNKNKDWIDTDEAKELYNEIVKVYEMLAELIETKNFDDRIILEDNLSEIHSLNPVIPTNILTDEKNDNAMKIFAEFLKNNCIGQYYSIVAAGENQNPILIISYAYEDQESDFIIPELGYNIDILGCDEDGVYIIGDTAPQSKSAGPWYFYKNKLLSLSRRGGYYVTDIKGQTYTRNIHEDDQEVYSNWKVVKLYKNRGDGIIPRELLESQDEEKTDYYLLEEDDPFFEFILNKYYIYGIEGVPVKLAEHDVNNDGLLDLLIYTYSEEGLKRYYLWFQKTDTPYCFTSTDTSNNIEPRVYMSKTNLNFVTYNFLGAEKFYYYYYFIDNELFLNYRLGYKRENSLNIIYKDDGTYENPQILDQYYDEEKKSDEFSGISIWENEINQLTLIDFYDLP